MTYKDDSSRMGLTECALECFLLHVPCSLSVWILLFFFVFVQANLSSVTGHTVLVCSLGLPLLSSLSIPSYPSYHFLSQCLLVAMCVALVVVVLSLHLLVTKEVAPPAFRVVHLSGRPRTPHPLHLPFI